MPLSVGSRLGPYEIVAPIGAGGMGEVYRARAKRLDRTVAIKVLPEQRSSNLHSRERFEREPKAISSLSHPNICALYDVGHQDGVDFLVMEYLEGDTLAHRLRQGPLPPEQVLRYAIQITEALDTAHRHGVIHRDLKPGNIMLTKTGLKLLDFGLAKVRAAEAGARLTAVSTQAIPLTGEGTIVGTLPYMAPEQVEGAEADARTDIFALGAVIYEMATVRQAFEGKSHASLIAAILEREPPPISALQTTAPPALDHVVRTCLAKDSDARWQTAHDVLIELKWIAESGSQPVTVKPLLARKNRRELLLSVLVASLSVAFLILAFAYFREKPVEGHPIKFQVPMPDKVSIQLLDAPAASPDGRRLAFTGVNADGNRLVWTHSMDALGAVPLLGTETAYLPFWSPDSRFIAFFSVAGELKKVDLSGGPPQTICELGAPGVLGAGGSWNRDGVILFGTENMPLRRVSADGGEPQPLLELNKSRTETEHAAPHFLPDGRHFLYVALGAEPRENATFVGSLDSRQTDLVLPFASTISYISAGFLIYARQQTVIAQKFNAKTLRVTGAPFPIAEQVQQATYAPGISASKFSISEDGVLAYRGGNSGIVRLAWYNREGKRLASIGESGDYPQIALSPEETRLAVERVDSGTRNLWILELASGIFSRLTFNPAGDYNPVWSPNGHELVFSSTYNGYQDLHRKALGGEPEQVVYHSTIDKGPYNWSKDGTILFISGTDFHQIPLNGHRGPTTVLKSPFGKDLAAVSPDGRWVAYESTESGRWEVYVAAFPSFSDNRQVSSSGGCQPLWRKDGKELFYLTLDGKLSAVAVNAGSNLQSGAPRVLFQPPVRVNPNQTEYCVTGDGKKFIFREPVDVSAEPITVVLNWNAGLKR